MTTFRIHLMGQNQPLTLDLPCDDVDELADRASRARFLTGHMLEPDGDGVCRRVMISTYRIECVIEAD